MKKLLLVMAVVSMMFITPALYAAQIDGTVRAVGGTPLKADGYIQAYIWNDTDGTWDLQDQRDDLGPDNDYFKFEDLPEGTYYFMTGGTGYITEYYNDTTNFDDKETKDLTEDDTDTLDDIELSPTPFLLSEATITPEELGIAGGTVKISANLVNNTKTQAALWVWPIIRTVGSEQFGSPDSLFTPADKTAQPKQLKVAPKKKQAVTFSIKVPAAAPNDTTYDVSIHGGKTQWEPTVQSALVGTLYKGAQTGLALAPPKTASARVPAKISPCGTVLQWTK